MTLLKGMLLFDVAEKPINGWENQLGYRGTKEVWKRKLKDLSFEEWLAKQEDYIKEKQLEDQKAAYEFYLSENYEVIEIDLDEDSEEDNPVWEVIYSNQDVWEMIDYGYGFEEADAKAKAWMKEN